MVLRKAATEPRNFEAATGNRTDVAVTEPWRKRLFWLIVSLMVLLFLVYLATTQLTGGAAS